MRRSIYKKVSCKMSVPTCLQYGMWGKCGSTENHNIWTFLPCLSFFFFSFPIIVNGSTNRLDQVAPPSSDPYEFQSCLERCGHLFVRCDDSSICSRILYYNLHTTWESFFLFFDAIDTLHVIQTVFVCECVVLCGLCTRDRIVRGIPGRTHLVFSSARNVQMLESLRLQYGSMVDLVASRKYPTRRNLCRTMNADVYVTRASVERSRTLFTTGKLNQPTCYNFGIRNVTVEVSLYNPIYNVPGKKSFYEQRDKTMETKKKRRFIS